jgi:hypothetical protein
VPADDLVLPPASNTLEALVITGNKPHLTRLHDYTLEDVGLLDVARLVPSTHL